MRTNKTAEQHRYEAGRLEDEALEWAVVFGLTRSAYAEVMGHLRKVQARWHWRRWSERNQTTFWAMEASEFMSKFDLGE